MDTLIFVNQAYCNYFGMSREELLGSNLYLRLPELERDKVRSQLDQIDTDHPVQVIENQVISHSGQLRWMRWTNQGFFDQEGCAIEFQSTGRDISERKAAEEQLARYQANLENIQGSSG